MVYAFFFVLGAVGSASILIIWYYNHIGQLKKDSLRLDEWDARLASQSTNVAEQTRTLEQRKEEFQETVTAYKAQAAEYLAEQTRTLEHRTGEFQKAETAFKAQKVQYDDLLTENNSLKQDLFNLTVQLKKTDRDHAAMDRRQNEIEGKTNELAKRYLDENVTWVADKLNPNNFGTCRKRLLNVAQRCRDLGFDLPEDEEGTLVQDLKRRFEDVVRAEFQRQEQARIKAQIREEERFAREVDKQIKQAQREQATIEAALEKALKDAKDEHSAEIEHLRARLKEAQENSERAISQAQLTKSGHVYIISNIGSFGDGVYKIGMSRRLEPMDRVKELGGASVPFPFDVHMMISCDNAPTLENALHRELHKQRLNKVNFRKEFFRADLDSIRGIVDRNHGEVDFVADPDALQYRESLELTDEDYEFVEQTVQSLIDDEEDTDVDE